MVLSDNVVGAIMPSRRWPLMAATALAPVSIGLVVHALIQADRRMLVGAVALGVIVLLVGSLPASTDPASGRESIRQRAHERRRLYLAFLGLTLVALVGWSLLPLRLTLGVVAVVLGFAHLIVMGRYEAAYSAAHRTVEAYLIPWCYALGPSGALALAVLAVRPQHLGIWRDPVYLGLGRVATVAAVIFWIVIERYFHQRYRKRGVAVPARFLPERLLIFLLAATGILVPGGGSPYAVSWVVAWAFAATFERRLSLTSSATETVPSMSTTHERG